MSLLHPLINTLFSHFSQYCYHRTTHEVDSLWFVHQHHHTTKHPTAILSILAEHYQEYLEGVYSCDFCCICRAHPSSRAALISSVDSFGRHPACPHVILRALVDALVRCCDAVQFHTQLRETDHAVASRAATLSMSRWPATRACAHTTCTL